MLLPARKVLFTLLSTFLIITSTNVLAKDEAIFLSIEDAINSDDFKSRLDPDIKFIWGDQSHPEPNQNYGEFVSNKKTNSVGKSVVKACEWALLSALLSFQDRVRSEGGNAVVNLRSYYKSNEYSSTSDYECHDGNIMTGVALKGRVVVLP